MKHPPLKLTDLEAELVTYIDPGHRRRPEVITLASADGVQFLCPKCFHANGGAVGTHMVLCWFAGKVPDEESPGPGRWTPQGTGLEDLTFVPGQPARSVSVHLQGGCGWHGYVRGGWALDS